MRLTLTATALVGLGLLAFAPGFPGNAYAHGGAYRGPPGEIPPNSREPHDPPPPPSPGGPKTPGGEGEGPETPDGGIGGGPETPDDGAGDGPSGGSPDGGAPPPGTGSGPTSPRGGGRTGTKQGPSYADWIYWWNFNKDGILRLQSSLNRTHEGTGSLAHRFGSRAAGAGRIVTPTEGAIRNDIVPVLRDLIAADKLNFDIRSAALLALAKIGDESIVDVAEAMARDTGKRFDKVERESAGLAFGLLQRNTDDVRDVLIELVGDKSKDSSFVRPFSAVSLGLLGMHGDPDGRVSEALVKVLGDKESKDDVKPACLLALGLLGDDRIVPDLLVWLETTKARKDADESLTDLELAYVVQALGRIGAPGTDEPGRETAVVDAMEKILRAKASNPWHTTVRRSAAIALGQLAPNADASTRERIVGTLKRVAAHRKRADKDTSVRSFAMIALGRIGASETVGDDLRDETVDTLRHLLDEARPATVLQPYAALGLGLIGRAERERGTDSSRLEERIRQPLREKFAGTRAPRERGAYAVASGLVGDPLAVDALVEVLEDRGSQKALRGYCALGLGLIGAREAREAIGKALAESTDRELRVQTAVASGLMGDAAVIPSLVEILRSKEESQYILGSVALALGQIGDERAIEPLVAIARDDVNEFPDLTRALATVALGQIGDRRDVPVLSEVGRDVNYRAYVPAIMELLTIL